VNQGRHFSSGQTAVIVGRIFTDRLPKTTHRYARRTCRLSASIEQIDAGNRQFANSRVKRPLGEADARETALSALALSGSTSIIMEQGT